MSEDIIARRQRWRGFKTLNNPRLKNPLTIGVFILITKNLARFFARRWRRPIESVVVWNDDGGGFLSRLEFVEEPHEPMCGFADLEPVLVTVFEWVARSFFRRHV